MSKHHKSAVAPYWVLGLSDIGMYLLAWIPGVIAWGSTLMVLRHFWNHAYFAALLPAVPVLLIAIFLIALRLLRLCVPRLKKGVYPLGLNKGFLGWYASLALNRAADVSGLRPLIQSMYVLRFLHWRSLGAKIAYRVNVSMGTTFLDMSLIEIGEGSTLADLVTVSCHTFVGEKLAVFPVRIGKNVFVGTRTLISPRSTIGDGAWIGLGNMVLGETLAPGTIVKDFEWREGNPLRASKTTNVERASGEASTE